MFAPRLSVSDHRAALALGDFAHAFRAWPPTYFRRIGCAISTKGAVSDPESKQYFTVDDANESVSELNTLFSRVMQLRAQLKTLYQSLDDSGHAPDGEELQGTIESADNLPDDAPAVVRRDYVRFRALMSTLREQVEDIQDTGAIIKDIEIGLVDWPALHQGREVLLCWRYGEPEVSHWHETHAGYSDRRPVSELDPMEPGAG